MRAPTVEPGSALAEGGHRLMMAAGAALLAARRDPVSRAIADALRTAATGHQRPAERAWINEVEARRAELPRELAAPEPAAAWDPSALEGAAGMCGMLSVPRAWGRFLFHLVRRLQPQSCLEIGTGLGVSATYQAAALELNGAGKLTTVDTMDHARAADASFAKLGLAERASLIIDEPGAGVARAIELSSPFDFVLIDADHTEAAAISDFDSVAPHLGEGAVVIVDDIAWENGMQRAWEVIRHRPQVELGLGLRRFGIVAMSTSQRPG